MKMACNSNIGNKTHRWAKQGKALFGVVDGKIARFYACAQQDPLRQVSYQPDSAQMWQE